MKRSHIKPIAVSLDGERLMHLESSGESILHNLPAQPMMDASQRMALLQNHIEPMINRELNYQGISGDGGFSAQMIAWVEIVEALKK